MHKILRYLNSFHSADHESRTRTPRQSSGQRNGLRKITMPWHVIVYHLTTVWGPWGCPKIHKKQWSCCIGQRKWVLLGTSKSRVFAYCHGKDVEKNLTKAVYHYQIAAVGGITIARYEYLIILYYYICVCKVSHPQSCLCLPRHNLGCLECQAGNVSRGMKH